MMLPIMFIAFAVGLGSGAIAGEEEKGTLDFLLANPILRGRLIIEKVGAMITSIFVLAVIFLMGMMVGIAVVNIDISLLYLAEATLSTLMLGLVFGTLAFFLGALKGNRGMSIGVASAAAVVTYFLNSLGGMVEALKPYRLLSPFYHHLEPNILINGLDMGHFLVLAGLVVILFALSLPAFQRRDIAV